MTKSEPNSMNDPRPTNFIRVPVSQIKQTNKQIY